MFSLKYDSLTSADANPDEEQLFQLAGGCCFDFHHKARHLFVVGTEEGQIYKCSKEYSSEHLLSFQVCSFN